MIAEEVVVAEAGVEGGTNLQHAYAVVDVVISQGNYSAL